jgi:hypothetical protein
MRQQRTRELEAILDTFATEGYALIRDDMEAGYKQMVEQGWEVCKTGEEFFVMKGHIQRTRNLLALPQLVEQEYESLDERVFPDEAGAEVPTNPLED